MQSVKITPTERIVQTVAVHPVEVFVTKQMEHVFSVQLGLKDRCVRKVCIKITSFKDT